MKVWNFFQNFQSQKSGEKVSTDISSFYNKIDISEIASIKIFH